MARQLVEFDTSNTQHLPDFFQSGNVVLLDEKQWALNEWMQLYVSHVQYAGITLPAQSGILRPLYFTDNNCQLVLYFLRENKRAGECEVVKIEIHPSFLDLFDQTDIKRLLPFKKDQSIVYEFQPCNTSFDLLDKLINKGHQVGLLTALQGMEWMVQLLRRSLESLVIPFTACQVPACRFLSNELERTKIYEARKILEANIGKPFSIKELARKVAMNECYLKKGFKTIVGKTINDFQQDLRIEEAKRLLEQEHKTVTDVAAVLGFSSISHFSTAFKKATGMKPCDLLK